MTHSTQRVKIYGFDDSNIRPHLQPALVYIETLKGRSLFFPEAIYLPKGMDDNQAFNQFLDQNLHFAFPHLDPKSLGELKNVVILHINEFYDTSRGRRNPEIVCGISFDDKFPKESLSLIREKQPVFHKFIENLQSLDVVLPTHVRAMTDEEIAFGKSVRDRGHEQGAGHGIYFIEKNLIALNPTMTPLEILKYYIHENLHAVYPTLHEVDIRNLTDYVLWEVLR
jgi:hypothetical protein